MNPTTVRVDPCARGAWEVVLSDRGDDHVTCETLEEASRVAYRYALDRHPCELIVYDAYHRVVQRELIQGGEIEGGQSSKRLVSTDRRRSTGRRIAS